MDHYDYHFITIRFLTAVILAVFFGFFLVYLFRAESGLDYAVYSFEKESFSNLSEKELFTAAEKREFALKRQQNNFKSGLKKESFAIMAAAKESLLAVVTAEHFEEINSIFERERSVLNELQLELKDEREKLLQQKRKELEAELSQNLQQLRQKIRAEYSDYNQREIRANYLQIINLKIAVEVLAEDEAEKEKYQKRLTEVEKNQEELLAEKNSARNDQISAETRTLIMDFNSRYSNYREKIDSRQQQRLRLKEDKIEARLSKFRKQISLELKAARAKKEAEIEKIISKQKKYY